MLFEGNPVYIEFTAEGQVHSILTEVWYKKTSPVDRYAPGMPDPFAHYRDYDVDYCDSHEHYHAHESGSGPGHFPMKMYNRVNDAGEAVSYCYWAAPHIPLDFSGCRAPEECLALSEAALLPLLLPKRKDQEAYLHMYPEPTAQTLVTYWAEETGEVEEGEVVYCSRCQKHYDYEAWKPCSHIRWCDTCGMWSTPGGECKHRSADDASYVEPEERSEEELEEERSPYAY